MSDEEKKAIEYWKTHMEILHWNTQLASEHYIKVLLDLIEKQSKEIEELKDMKKELRLKSDKFWDNVVSKDKIKAIIEELQEDIKYSANPLSIDNSKFGIKVLQSLLPKEFPTTITKEELEKRWKE